MKAKKCVKRIPIKLLNLPAKLGIELFVGTKWYPDFLLPLSFRLGGKHRIRWGSIKAKSLILLLFMLCKDSCQDLKVKFRPFPASNSDSGIKKKWKLLWFSNRWHTDRLQVSKPLVAKIALKLKPKQPKNRLKYKCSRFYKNGRWHWHLLCQYDQFGFRLCIFDSFDWKLDGGDINRALVYFTRT